MLSKRSAYILIGLGVCVLLSTWGEVSDWTEKVLNSEEEVRTKKVVYWTNSGSPEVDLKRASQFEGRYPDIRVEPNFRESGGLRDVLYMSLLSGNPPDYMDCKLNELRDYILIGAVMPLDDLIAKAGGEEKYLEQFDPSARVGRVYRFNVNPDDIFLRKSADGGFEHPREAARLLAMDGKVAGFRPGISTPATLTYNKRLFREAAKEFPNAGLLDANGEPAPPASWLELYQKAMVLREYGRRAGARLGLNEPICHGIVVQGQRQRDIMRGIRPLAYRAGTMSFAFQGDTEKVQRFFTDPAVKARHAGKPIGYFDYHNPASLAAFALLLKMKQDGLVLPGTESREYEVVRMAVASGKAAMVIDGPQAAWIGAERVPWAAQDIGSAPVPVPYGDASSGWTAERIEREKEQIHQLLGLDKVGILLPPGNPMPQTADDWITFFTSPCRSPDAAWLWNHFTDEDIIKSECRRGMVRSDIAAMKHRGDSEWFPYPYQEQIYRVLERNCALWPEMPRHGPVDPAIEDEVYYKYFFQTELRDLPTVLSKAREEIALYSEASNRDLAHRIEQGLDRPEQWTFPDWSAKNSVEFFHRQQRLSRDSRVRAQIQQVRKELVAFAARQGGLGLLDRTGTDVSPDIWRFRPADSPAQILYIPALMIAVAGAWLLSRMLRNRRAGRPLTAGVEAAKRGWHGYLFVLPGILTIFAFTIYPSLYQFYLAVHSGDGLGPMQYVGAAHFDRILNFTSGNFDSVFWTKVVPNTLIYMVVVTSGQIAIALLLASLLNMPLAGNRYFRILFFIPLVTSLAIVSVIMIGLLKGSDSGLNEFLGMVGLKFAGPDGNAVDWLGDSFGLSTVMGVGIWHGLPYNIILLLAGLQSIEPQLYEAARVDGAGAWKRFLHVTVPEMMPILIIIAFGAFLGAARAFSLVFVLTEGGINHSSELVATYIFKKGFMKPEGQVPDLGYAAALGIVYSLMLAGLTIANVMIVARRWKRRLEAETRGNAPQPVTANA
jgi:ABC-type sugar transport system permease subunit/ABC-type glycerol-3-phosphate transport system substrate-binding protein